MNRLRFCTIFIVLFAVINLSCHLKRDNYFENGNVQERDTIEAKTLGILEGSKLIIKDDIDLQGHVCLIPTGITIVVQGGIIRNGLLIGQETKLIYNGPIFDNIKISGSWIVPVIRTTMFKNLKYENSLIDVLSLTNSKIKNKVIIDKDDYLLRTDTENGICLKIVSNTDFVLNGTIRLLPNNFSNVTVR